MPDPRSTFLTWHRFKAMSQACKDFTTTAPCVDVIADSDKTPLYIGCSIGVGEQRYRGGTASAFDAAMHGSGNMVFAASIAASECATVEKALIWAAGPQYNKQGMIIPLSDLDAASLVHEGDVSAFAHLTRVFADGREHVSRGF